MQCLTKVVLVGIVVLSCLFLGESQQAIQVQEASIERSAVKTDDNDLDAVEVHMEGPFSPSDVSSSPIPSNCTQVTKPWLVLHVGPPKTGSSSIQAALGQFHDASLTADNYSHEKWIFQIGDDKQRCVLPMANVLRKTEMNQPKKLEHSNFCWEFFLSRMERLANQQRNVVMSDEVVATTARHVKDLEYSFVDRMIEDLGPTFRLAVIVVYRRYFDLLNSQYNQKYKAAVGKKESNEWPGSGGEHVPSYPRFVDAILEALKEGKSVYGTTPEQVLPAFRGKVDLLYVMDYHDGDLLTNFFCNALPDAPQTCQTIRDLEARPPSVNVGTSLVEYDRLSTAAYAQGWIDGTRYKRPDMASAVRIYNEKVLNATWTDLPLTCASVDSMKTLFKRSLAMERNVLADHGDAKAHLDHYNAFRAARKHCSIDVLAVLQDSKWQAFFQHYA
eukprot:scaffold2363_cov159-Amphora_coffeaeformis.AAC.22